MARRKKRSDAVSFRLPIKEWPLFLEQCEAEGLTRSLYAEKVVRQVVLQRKAQER